MLEAAIRTVPVFAMASLVLSGCASSNERYPSLATRDVERVQGTFEPVAPTVLTPEPAPSGQADRLASLTAMADSAHGRFLAAVPGARAAVNAVDAAVPDSNRWAAAQVALADLESLRSQAAIALGDLDLLYAQASTGFVEREAIADARRSVISNIQTEDAILAELRAQAD